MDLFTGMEQFEFTEWDRGRVCSGGVMGDVVVILLAGIVDMGLGGMCCWGG